MRLEESSFAKVLMTKVPAVLELFNPEWILHGNSYGNVCYRLNQTSKRLISKGTCCNCYEAHLSYYMGPKEHIVLFNNNNNSMMVWSIAFALWCQDWDSVPWSSKTLPIYLFSTFTLYLHYIYIIKPQPTECQFAGLCSLHLALFWSQPPPVKNVWSGFKWRSNASSSCTVCW